MRPQLDAENIFTTRNLPEVQQQEVAETKNRMNINEIADAIHSNAKDKGFHFEKDDLAFMATATANIHGEVSELWEAYRAGTEEAACDKWIKGCHLSCREEELADIIIRALDVSRRLGVDIEKAIRIKHEFNLTRPTLHGKRN